MVCKYVIDDGLVGQGRHTHQGSQFRWTASMGNVQSTTRWPHARTGPAAGLSLLIHG